MTAAPTAADRRGGLAATCCAIMFLYAVYFGMLGVLLPVLGASFRLGPEAQGRLFPADFIGFVLGVLVCGSLSDLWGRKTVLLIGLAVYAVGLALFGFAPSFPLALLASALIGGGSGAMETVASALASDLYPERRAFLINGIQIAFGAGAAIGPTLAQTLLATGTGWRLLYLGVAAGVAALFVVLWFQAVPPAPSDQERVNFAALVGLLKHPLFGALCLAQALYVGAEVSFFSWMPSYLEHQLRSGAAWAGIVVTVFWVAMTVGRVGSGSLLHRWPLSRLILLLGTGSAVCSLLTLLANQPLLVMVGVALTGLCLAGLFGFILSEAGERFPALAGTAFGGVVAAGGVGGAVFPWIVSAMAGMGGNWRGALMMVPALALGVAGIGWMLEKRPRVADKG